MQLNKEDQKISDEAVKYRKSQEKDDFSDFFYNASDSEREALIKDVMRKATQDQLAIIKKAKEM